MSENSVLCEASGLVRQIAAPATGKAALFRAYRKIGTWTYNRVKDVYYADRRIRISADEIDGLRAIARGKTEAPKAPNSIAGKYAAVRDFSQELILITTKPRTSRTVRGARWGSGRTKCQDRNLPSPEGEILTRAMKSNRGWKRTRPRFLSRWRSKYEKVEGKTFIQLEHARESC
jgi:hypothetical protein